MNRPRFCYIIDPTQDVDAHGGYVPSLVREDEPGHSPMTGDPDKLQTPWVWGRDLKVAEACASDMNRRLGLSDEDVAVIVTSSMRSARFYGGRS